MKTKRVFELEKGDEFFYFSTPCRVTRIYKGRIYYKPTSCDQSSWRDSFGAKNQMKVEFVGNYTKCITQNV